MFSWLKKYFIPHYENNYKPEFLRYKSSLLVLLVVIIVELAFLVQVFVVFDKTSFLASVLPGVLTTLTNEERSHNNAPPLTKSDLLAQAAQLKADDMAANGYFAHTSPDGKTPWYWLDQVGYEYSLAGENLAVNFFESDDVAQAWMDSPTHRANIVKPNYTEVGIAVARGVYEGEKTVFVAQFFGTPIPTATAPSPKTAGTTNSNVTPVNSQPKPTQPPVTKPKVTPTAPRPTVNPRTVAVAPTSVQVLGEETNSLVVPNENEITFSNFKAFVAKVLASPREYVTYIYGGIVLFMILVLLIAIFIKREFQHPAMITRGLAVVAVIIVLLFVNIKILHLDTKVPTEGLSASVIAY
jgi:hypothetical protein